jgi:hypothetical protein
MVTNNAALSTAVRAHWRAWLPFWLVEGVWVALGFASSVGVELPSATFWIFIPFFFFAFFRAAGPYMRRQVTLWQQSFWVLLVPFAFVLVLFAVRLGLEVARAA